MQKSIRMVITRKWFDIVDFVNDLATSELAATTSNDVNYLFDLIASWTDDHFVGQTSAIGQPTWPTQPSIP